MSKETLRKKMTLPRLQRLKQNGEKLVMLTAYDALFASLEDQAGVDIILVGDSVGMVFAGHETTLPVTLDEIVYHTKAVARGINSAFLVADMPFLTFQINPEETLRNAGRLIQEAGAEAVKIEGVHEETIRKLVHAGIPVMGHLGVTPQSIHQLGGYGVQGKGNEAAARMLADAHRLEEAGCFSLVLEKVPADLAAKITTELTIPTIGIGAGPHCDGQVLVNLDMLGMYESFQPKFVRRYAELAGTIRDAVSRYAEDIRNGEFPGAEESF